MTKTKLLLNCLLFSALFSFAGCGNKNEIKKVDLNKREEIAAISQEAAVIKVGLIPEQDIRKMAARYEPLAEYLSKKLNLKVVLVYLDNYGEVCDKFMTKQLDAAFFGSFSYALTHAKAQVEPIARPDYQGASTYRGLVLVRKDSNIRAVADMKDKRLALVHKATYAGYLFALLYFKLAGIDNLDSYFSRVIFTGSHDKAIFALLKGEVDVAIPKDLVYQRIAKENPDIEKKLLVLSVSQPVPSNALCLAKAFNPALKNQIKSALLEMDKDPAAKPVLEALGGATRFIETNDSDYRYLYETIRALGIDLKTYPYYGRPDMGFQTEK